MATPCLIETTHLRIFTVISIKMAVIFTKLMKLMIFLAVFLEIWYAVLSGWVPIELSPPMYQALLPVSKKLPYIVGVVY